MGQSALPSRLSLLCGTLLAAASLASAATALPKAQTLVSDMGMGYNIGNTMEVPKNPTLWGNTVPSKQLIDSVKKAGFNTVRIPTAWFTHSDTSANVINTGWLDSVKTVVDYCIANNMYVILNSHWDNGWLEDNVFSGTHPDRNNKTTTTDSSLVRKRQYAYWKQIAEVFKDYDEHLLFAGANEPGVNDPRASGDAYKDNGQYTFDAARMKILQYYTQAFVDAVRSTGGYNDTRTLIVQSPRTEFDKSNLLADHMPTDPAGAGYLMAEIHFYPYLFSLMEEDADWGIERDQVAYYWGDESHPTDTLRNCAGCGPSYVDSVFNLMKTRFTSKEIPVVVGEFGAIKRLSTLSGENLARHLRSRALFYGHVAKAAKANGLIPVLWDTGAEDDKNMTVIRRQTKTLSQVGQIVDFEVLNAMRKAYGLDTLKGNSIDALVAASTSTTNNSLSLAYDYKQDTTSYSSIRLPSTVKNLSSYKGITIRAKVTGAAAQVAGDYGFISMDLAVMTGTGWDWTDVHFGTLSKDWKDYSFTFTSKSTEEDKDNQVLYLTDASAVNAFVIQTYLKYYIGTVLIDQVLLIKADGTADTLENFNKKIPEKEGGIITAELVKTVGAPTAIAASSPLVNQQMHLQLGSRQLTASFESATAGAASIRLLNAQGQLVAEKRFEAARGNNVVSLESGYRGLGILVLDMGHTRMQATVSLK